MRESSQIMSMLLELARYDKRIRTVFQTGSRVNPLVKRDDVQDYDIIYCVTDLEEFEKDTSFLDAIDGIIFYHSSVNNRTLSSNKADRVYYTILLEDGVKIDITFCPVSITTSLITTETLLLLHMDKDNLIQQLPVSSDFSYRPVRPTKNEFDEVMSDFFYYVIEVIPYLYRLNSLGSIIAWRSVQDKILQLTSWFLADEKEYKVSFGKNYRYLEKFLPDDAIEVFRKLYITEDVMKSWEALFAAMALFRKFGLSLAQRLGYKYPKEEDVKISAYVRATWSKFQMKNRTNNTGF